MLRFIIWLPIAAVLGACASTGFPSWEAASQEKLRAGGKGVVIVHTSLHDQRCTAITAFLGQPDEAGRFVQGPRVELQRFMEVKRIPGWFEVPAGEYGFVSLRCVVGRSAREYNASLIKREGFMDNTGSIYAAPIARFTVGPGEVVDIGSLRLPSQMLERAAFEAPKGTFVPVVTPIPEALLKNLASAEPDLYRARIQRLMTASTDCHQVGDDRFRCPVQRPKRVDSSRKSG